MRRGFILAVAASIAVLTAIPSNAAGTDVRLTHDEEAPGYVSAYTLATGQAYSDDVLDECSVSRGRQNEPAVGVDPRDTRVLIGSANDYCGTYAGTSAANNFGQPGPIWLGFYRSENGGQSFVSSLVPGYPGDESPFADLAHIRTASSGDPVVAWDDDGRVFLGSESSDDPAGTLKTFGDEWVAVYENPDGPDGDTINDGKEYVGTEIVAKGSSAPFLLGKFNDKTAIEADRTQSECNDNVYFSWSRFTGNGGVAIYFSRSTDHGRSWSSPMKLTPGTHDVQNPDIAITGSGTIYVTYTRFQDGQQTTAVGWAKSTDCGATFTRGDALVEIPYWEMRDVAAPVPFPESAEEEEGGGKGGESESPDALESEAPAGTNRDCGDFLDACAGPYTFPRAGTGVRSTADQYDTETENVYIVVEGIEARYRGRHRDDVFHGRAGRRQPGGHLLHPPRRGDGRVQRARADRRPAPRTPVLPGHLGGRGCAPRDLVRHAERPGVLGYTADLQRRGRDHVRMPRRLRHVVVRRWRYLGGRDAPDRRAVEPELRAVRRSSRAVHRGLHMGDVDGRVRVRHLDGPSRHGPG